MSVKTRKIFFVLMASILCIGSCEALYILSSDLFVYTFFPICIAILTYAVLSFALSKLSLKNLFRVLLLFLTETVLTTLILGQVFDYHGLFMHAGFYRDTEENGWVSREYVLGSRFHNKGNILAESYGFGIDDTIVDIDGDGEKELVCNTTTMADGHKEVIIYDLTDKNSPIVKKKLDISKLKLQVSNTNVNAIQSEYNKDTNTIIITYLDKNGTSITAKVDSNIFS